ncbi:MAG TPA: TetR/AcrR family transcriptional regulator [Galbitalea sp.]|nr:TetR/AcrR family transcriptional regulator [Galbitalea sp.]
MVTRRYLSTLREQSSQRTREAILDAAAELLATNGYAKTTLAAVARRAGVAANTVYASVGGKAELFLALLERGTGADVIDETLTRIDSTADPRESIALVAFAYRRSFESARAVISVLDEAGLHDPAIAAAVDESRRLYRGRLDGVAAHLRSIGALAPSVGDDEASDVLWFYFGFAAWPQLRELGWDPDRIEAWLADRAAEALLG